MVVCNHQSALDPIVLLRTLPVSLLAFPGGGISPDGTIGAFKDGAFIIAVANRVPVVPVAIEGTRRIWPPGRTAIHCGCGTGGGSTGPGGAGPSLSRQVHRRPVPSSSNLVITRPDRQAWTRPI
jgi:Acyltransferase